MNYYEIVDGRQFLKGSDSEKIVDKPFIVLCTDHDGRKHVFKQKNAKHGVVGFSSADEAKEAYLNRSKEETVFIVLKDSDRTEGRGPMIVDKCFSNIENAERYIEKQPGIFGSQQSRRLYFSVNSLGEIFSTISHNGYEIKEIELEYQ